MPAHIERLPKKTMTSKIISWNVNGIRAAARKGFDEWLANTPADIIGLQETRALENQIPANIRHPKGWHMHLHPAERLGYSGVGLYSRRPFDEITTGIGLEEQDREGRIQMARFGELLIVNGYFPNGNGKNRDNSRVPFKLEFYQHLREQLSARAQKGEKILVMGDFNTAHKEIDLARPKQNEKTSGFLPEERLAFDQWIDDGWTDTFRQFHPEGERYSWWSNRSGARERNVGWRIDYILASPAALPYVVDAEIHHEVLGSDHCPISVRVQQNIYG